MEKIDQEKGKEKALNDIYKTDRSVEKKSEFFPKLKQILQKFWQSEKGLPYLVVFLAVIAIVFGLWQADVNIKGDFLKVPEGSSNKLSINKTPASQEITALSLKDTDSDGLSDYDELYVFYTSPYLEDSDSDGIGDKDEIAAGSDPNCPKGKICQEAPPPKTEVIRPSPSGTGNIEDLLRETTGEMSGTASGQEIYEMLSNISAAEIRQILIQGGIPESLIRDVSDEDLLEMSQEALRQQGL